VQEDIINSKIDALVLCVDASFAAMRVLDIGLSTRDHRYEDRSN
jgi:hypothetical protein